MNKKIILLVMFLFGVQSSTPLFASELTDDYFDIATNYFNSNNYAKSLEYLDLVLLMEPDNLQAMTLRHKVSPLPVNNSKEMEETAKILSATPNPENLVILEIPKADVEKMAFDSEYYNTKGEEFYQKKEYDSAVEYFFKAVSVNKCNAQAYNNLGMAYWSKNKPALAIRYFKKSNFISKTYTQPLVNLAMLYKQLGNCNQQLYYLKKAVCLDNQNYLAYFHLGEYYKDKGDYQQAVESYKAVVKINPQCSGAYIGLATSFFKLDEFNYCLLALDQYKTICPETDFVLYLTARADLALAQYDNAKTNIDKAIAINDKPEYSLELAKNEYAKGDYQVALDIFQKLLQKSDSAEVFNYVGLCNYKLKHMEVAIANFNKAIALDGLRSIYYYNLAQCYKSIEDNVNYVKYYNMALKVNPIIYQDFLDLSYIYYVNGNITCAINFLNVAISRYPCVRAAYVEKLKIYEANNDNLNYNKTKELINERFNR